MMMIRSKSQYLPEDSYMYMYLPTYQPGMYTYLMVISNLLTDIHFSLSFVPFLQ